MAISTTAVRLSGNLLRIIKTMGRDRSAYLSNQPNHRAYVSNAAQDNVSMITSSSVSLAVVGTSIETRTSKQPNEAHMQAPVDKYVKTCHLNDLHQYVCSDIRKELPATDYMIQIPRLKDKQLNRVARLARRTVPSLRVKKDQGPLVSAIPASTSVQVSVMASLSASTLHSTTILGCASVSPAISTYINPPTVPAVTVPKFASTSTRVDLPPTGVSVTQPRCSVLPLEDSFSPTELRKPAHYSTSCNSKLIQSVDLSTIGDDPVTSVPITITGQSASAESLDPAAIRSANNEQCKSLNLMFTDESRTISMSSSNISFASETNSRFVFFVEVIFHLKRI